MRSNPAEGGDAGRRRRVACRAAYALVALAWLWPLTTPHLDRADSVGYLAPAISLVDDGDLMYYDEYAALGMNRRYFRPTPEGFVGNHWSVGLGLALAPSIGTARALEPGDATLGETALAAIHVTALIWAALLAFLAAGLVRRHVFAARDDSKPDRPWAWALVAALYVGTPLAFYTHVQAARPHLLEALLATALLAYSLDVWKRPSTYSYAIAGLLVGALAVVRMQAALLVVFPLAAIFWRLWDERRSTEQRSVLLGELGRLAALLAPAAALWLLQRSVTHLLYGSGNTGSLLDSLFDVELNLLDSLVNAHHGLLSWSPIVAFALVGLGLFCHRRPRLALPIIAFLVVQLYLNATSYDHGVDAYHNTRHWAAGGSFGSRRFLCCLPLFALGLAELVYRARSTRWIVPLSAALAACALWSLNLTLYSRAHLFEVLEQPMTWTRLLAVQSDALSAIRESVSDALAAGPGVADAARALLAVAVPVAVVIAIALAWRRVSPTRRPRYLAAACAAGLLFGIVGARAVATNTRASRDRMRETLATFQRKAAAEAWLVQRGILIEQARHRDLVGDERGAIWRYEEALKLGIGRSSLERYLELALALEGPDGADSRLRELARAHPGHAILLETAARFAREHR